MDSGKDHKQAVIDLHEAVVKGNVSKLAALLKTSQLTIDEADEDGMTALQQACYRGNVEIANILVSSGADVNWSKHKQGYTALMFATLSGKLEIVEYILSCGAKIDATNCLKRTAAEMAAFVGNHYATALINTFIDKEELMQFTKTKSTEAKLVLPIELVEPLYGLILRFNFAPTKVFLYLSSVAGKPLLDDWKSVVAILEELVGQHFTPHRTHEHIALKLHLLSAFVRHAGEFLEKEKDSDKPAPPIVLEPLIKNMLRGADPHGLPKGQEVLLRKSLISFPHAESTLWRQTVMEAGRSEPGAAPTALAVLEHAINGLSGFARSGGGAGDRTAINEPCATCNDVSAAIGCALKRCARCHEVAYCSAACQRLHWFTHKKYCPLLKEHHDAVAKTKPKMAEPTEAEIKQITADIQAQLRTE